MDDIAFAHDVFPASTTLLSLNEMIYPVDTLILRFIPRALTFY